ncbi:unnamed protein product, partial [Didymodactylos carnosus]
LLRHKTKYFIPFVIGGLLEVGGYIARGIGRSNLYNLGTYVVQALMLLIPPAFFSASIYMILSRLIRFTRGEKFSLIKVTRMSTIFVVADVVSLLLQGGGGGIQASRGLQSTGQAIIIFGLAVQVISFTLFLTVAITFQIRIGKSVVEHATTNVHSSDINGSVEWKQLLKVLYFSGCIILIRSAYRVAEYATGFDGYLMR